MAEAVGVSAAVVTLVSAAYESCQTLHHTIDGFRGAHEQIHALSSDLESFYLALGTVQATLQEEASSVAMFQRVTSENLSKALEDSMDIFKKIRASVLKYQTHDHTLRLGVRHRAKWTFDGKKIEGLRNELSQCKMTLNIAISADVRMSTNQIQSEIRATNATVISLRAQIAEYVKQLQQQEDILALVLSTPIRHSEEDRKNVKTDFQFTMRRFVDSDASSTSSISTPSTASFKVSSFEVVESEPASIFHTHWMSLSIAPAIETLYRQIQVRILLLDPAAPTSFNKSAKFYLYLFYFTVPLSSISCGVGHALWNVSDRYGEIGVSGINTSGMYQELIDWKIFVPALASFILAHFYYISARKPRHR